MENKGHSPDYTYADYNDRPDPSHRPLYLATILRYLRNAGSIRTVLDVGCGGGDFAEGLARNGFQVCGVDLSKSGIGAATARNIGRFETASVYDDLRIPFAVDSFDAVVCIETIEHLYSPRRCAARMYEAVRPGGLVIVTTPYWGYLKNVVLALSNRTDRSLTVLWEGGHIKHFSRKTLTRLMANEGFRVVGFNGCGSGWRAHVPYLWSGMLMVFERPMIE